MGVESTFTYDYEQPRDYHFCQDSVLFARFLADELSRESHGEARALDVCAGCGVIGLELGFYRPDLERIDFLEIQPEFRESLSANLTATGRDRTKHRIFIDDFRTFQSGAVYDFIFANPPYFQPGEGLPSPVALRNRCRFLLDGSLLELIAMMARSLKSTGVGYLLIKSGAEHGRSAVRDLEIAARESGLPVQIDLCREIRKTGVLRVRLVE